MRHVLKLKGGANIEIAKIVVKIVTAKEWVIIRTIRAERTTRIPSSAMACGSGDVPLAKI